MSATGPDQGGATGMSWRTGITIISFFALVAVIQYPRLADYVRDLSEPSTNIAVPDPVIAAPSSSGTPLADNGQPLGVAVTDDELTIDELKLLALDFINEDRKLHGLSPVAMGDNEAAQLHAEDMVDGRYVGHWWRDGRKPYMVYSETSGASYVSENAARSGFSEAEFAELCTAPDVFCEKVNPTEDIQRLHHAMVYDDAESNWLHRINILNPNHRKVNIGVAYTDRFLSLVQHFEGGDATAPRTPWFEGSTLKIRADLNRPDLAVFPTVQVFFEAIPEPRTAAEIEQFTSYCVGGGFTDRCGEPIVQIVPPPQPGTRYLNLPDNVVVARSWVVSGGDIEIAADVSEFATQPGYYTVTMFEDAGNGSSGSMLLQLSAVKS